MPRKFYFILYFVVLSPQLFAQKTSTDEKQLRQTLSPFKNSIVGKSLPGIDINEPYRYLYGKPGKYIYQMLSVDETSATKFEIHHDVNRKLREVKTWSLRIDNDFIEEWKADCKGNVHLLAQTHVDSGYRVVFAKHIILPVGARQGQRWQSESSLKVYDISDPGTVAYEGTLRSNKAYEGRFEVTTPAGKFDAILISDEYNLEIGSVDVTDKRCTFYAPNVGKVAEIDGFHVSAFLFYHEINNQVKILLSSP